MNEDELRKLRRLISHVQQSIEPSLQAIAKWHQQMKPQLDAFSEFSRRVSQFQPPEQILADIRKLQGWFAAHGPELAAALEVLRTQYQRSLSDNLHPLDADVAIAALELMSKDDGVVVVWMPPAEIVEQLVDVDTMAERDAIVVACGADIAVAAIEILSQVNSPRLQPLRAALSEGWAVWETGHRTAAQALATATLGTVVHDLLSYEKFAALRNEWRREDALDGWPLIEIRYGLLMCRTAVAVEQTHHQLPGYNRHSSAHKVDAVQYTPANALHGLMLVTAWARELQALDAREDLSDL